MEGAEPSAHGRRQCGVEGQEAKTGRGRGGKGTALPRLPREMRGLLVPAVQGPLHGGPAAPVASPER